MGEYWIWNGTEAEGPYDAASIRARPDLASLHVCRVGEETWTPAGEIPELVPSPVAAAPRAAAAATRPAPARKDPVVDGCLKILRWAALVIGALVVGTLAIGGYAYHRGLLAVPTTEEVVAQLRSNVPGGDLIVAKPGSGVFDLELAAPCDPLGLAAQGGTLLVGSRGGNGSIVRIHSGMPGVYRFERVPVREEVNDQEITVSALAVDGSRVVGIAMAAWFQEGDGSVFTFHDPATLALTGHSTASPHAGAMVWDGTGWWVGIRKNTPDAPEESALLRCDADFRVVAKYPAPGPGCQGLAWDGRNLWWADVFHDALYRIEVVNGIPGEANRHMPGVDYLSGLAWDGTHLWIAEYGDKTVRRISAKTYGEWTGGPPPAVPPPIPGAAEPEVTAARERKENHFTLDTGSEEADYEFLEGEWREGRMLGSWKIWIGPDLFRGDEVAPATTAAPDEIRATIPKFVHLEVTVEGQDGTTFTKKTEVPVSPGWNEAREQVLAEGLGPGTYNVTFFLHAQYRRPDGGDQILNDNLGWLQVKR